SKKVNSSPKKTADWESKNAQVFNDALQLSRQNERQASNSDLLLRRVREEVGRALACTDRAFKRRVQECKEALKKLENEKNQEQNKTERDLERIESKLKQVEQCLADQTPQLKMVKNRKLVRSVERPPKENCNDQAQNVLDKELEVLQDTENQLQKSISELKKRKQALRASLSELNESIDLKNESLKIDEDQCLGERRTRLNKEEFD
ncbi:MAG: hypothetical protein MHPSP_001276, partial [Paramarteilia canceri]